MPNSETKKAIASKVNLSHYDSLKVGEYVPTEEGEFIVISKPNLYQPLDTRYWEFQMTADRDGEPVMDSPSIKIWH